jgi:hypothetical protein
MNLKDDSKGWTCIQDMEHSNAYCGCRKECDPKGEHGVKTFCSPNGPRGIDCYSFFELISSSAPCSSGRCSVPFGSNSFFLVQEYEGEPLGEAYQLLPSLETIEPPGTADITYTDGNFIDPYIIQYPDDFILNHFNVDYFSETIQTIGPSGGTITNDRASFTFPPGALDRDYEFTLHKVALGELIVVDSDILRQWVNGDISFEQLLLMLRGALLLFKQK